MHDTPTEIKLIGPPVDNIRYADNTIIIVEPMNDIQTLYYVVESSEDSEEIGTSIRRARIGFNKI